MGSNKRTMRRRTQNKHSKSSHKGGGGVMSSQKLEKPTKRVKSPEDFAEEGRSKTPPAVITPRSDVKIVRPIPITIDKKGAMANFDARSVEEGRSKKYSPKAQETGSEIAGGKKKRKTRKSRKSKKHYKKGSASKTRKGRKDFVTHKGDKKFHRRGHRQSYRQGQKSMIARLLGL